MSETLVILPNVEALISAFFRTQPELVALVDDRVYTELPKSPTFPAMRVTQYDDITVTDMPLWVIAAQIQVDSWGGSKHDAWLTASTARGLLSSRLSGEHTLGTVSGVRFGGMRDEPDTDYEPAKPRFYFTASVFAHPNR